MKREGKLPLGMGDTVSGAGTGRTFSRQRTIHAPDIGLPPELRPNTRLRMDGQDFLSKLPADAIPVAFFDPQYRGILDRMAYGNEGRSRERRRSALQQMPEPVIRQFISGMDRVLIPSGHLFLWVDKFHLCEGVSGWFSDTGLELVDMLTWDKGTFGMGYRTRRRAEYCVVLQKRPKKAKGVWKVHNIPDVVRESVSQKEHPHSKPVELQGALLCAVSNEGDYVIDPAAGSFSVMTAARNHGRVFLGCDLNG